MRHRGGKEQQQWREQRTTCSDYEPKRRTAIINRPNVPTTMSMFRMMLATYWYALEGNVSRSTQGLIAWSLPITKAVCTTVKRLDIGLSG